MASIHLIKLSVGTACVDDLRRWQQSVLKKNEKTKRRGRTHHVTRMFPKRADELTKGGSIYWVIQGKIQARQAILAVEEVGTKAGRKCRLVLDPELVPVAPAVRGPFQGWRYLDPKDAPVDLELKGDSEDAAIYAELAELGLL